MIITIIIGIGRSLTYMGKQVLCLSQIKLPYSVVGTPCSFDPYKEDNTLDISARVKIMIYLM